MERHGGKIDHETIGDMEYLEAVIMENLRMHAPVLGHIRTCKEDCEACTYERLLWHLQSFPPHHSLRFFG